ncbi:hypothetical protein G6R40_03710 [Chryseobacterium sp. POL2]|uniref:DUF6029 family protein n=1 Tax=Chryseobacterium sp. POL2 TaxID=2713414 RepID=UPI0013E1DA6E|nr:DUF6029 family protein [Chryseobacterium sp. POL2]QIG88828.1 hypothetical protein G6R40_03710 [Chryseobacterium sp. POL2]
MKKKLLPIIMLLGQGMMYAQFNASLDSNNQYYVDDKKIKLAETEADQRFRSNSYLTMTYKYKQFTVGAQVESYEPKALLNYSPDFKSVNLGTYYVNYNNEKGVDVTLGHFYDQFGSGLALRTWEDRQLGIANSLVGGRVKLSFADDLATVKALYGKQRVGMGFDLSKTSVAGVDAEFQLTKALGSDKFDSNVGFSFVNKHESEDPNFINAPADVNIYGVRWNNEYKDFYLNAEYLYKTKDAIKMASAVDPVNVYSGNAMNVVLGFAKTGFGISGTLRRLENFNIYSDRERIGNQYNQALLNYTPALTKQFDYSLANIYVYQAQPQMTFFPQRKAGEIGSQFDINYQFKKGTALGGKYGTDIAVNFANWYGLKGKYRVYEDYNTVETKALDLGERYYSDFNVDIRKKLTQNWNTALIYVYQDYNTDRIQETEGHVYATTTVWDNLFKINKNSLKLELQHQWANSSYKNWAAALTEFNFKKNWSIFVSDMYNYGNDDKEKQMHYYTFGGVFRKNSTRIQASYGRQRGGLICVGGVCRMVPENTGFTLNINTTF